ncbi:MAG TPA: bifunctional oligoribonuclease/PAP phosphatase NrnA [Bacilli bacterium]|nr:bifunctional oligoribonuclease/PAP phosphatase NrnA [Bacilli bacterium]
MIEDLKKQIFEKILEYDTIIIHRHIRPDGDCLGSTIGLREILRASFPNKKIYSVGNNDTEYLYFIGLEDQIDDSLYKDALVIIVDTATDNRIFDERYKLGKFTIKIDHHIPIQDYANINYVRTDFPATCAVICDFYKTFEEHLTLPKSAALPLFVGMVTDTGRFKYRGVSGNVMRLAGMLLDYELDIEDIYARLYMKTKEIYKLQGYVYNKFKTTSHGVSYIYLSRNKQKKFKVDHHEAANLVNSLDSIKDSLIWMIFVEQPDKSIRVRLRSRFIAIDDIANQFNGGGHAQASGATVYSKREMKKLIAIADEKLRIFKLTNKDVF